MSRGIRNIHNSRTRNSATDRQRQNRSGTRARTSARHAPASPPVTALAHISVQEIMQTIAQSTSGVTANVHQLNLQTRAAGNALNMNSMLIVNQMLLHVNMHKRLVKTHFPSFAVEYRDAHVSFLRAVSCIRKLVDHVTAIVAEAQLAQDLRVFFVSNEYQTPSDSGEESTVE